MSDTTETSPADAAPAPVVYRVADGVATITLNRPDLRNVMSVEALKAMHAALADAATDEQARVIVITGSGNTFCAGADLRAATGAASEDKLWNGPRAIVNVLESILDHPKPVIAKVQGHVAGGGNGLVAACDLSVAAESAKFAFSEVRLGVAPAVISVVCLERMNVSDGYELFLTGERVSAQRMKQAGLLNQVVPDDALDAAVERYVDQLRRGGPNALAATKQLLAKVRRMERGEAFEYTAELSGRLFASAEAQAGMGAFLRREPAPWVPTPEA
jgi:methylglutaconyl-CoA hydratase